MIRAPIWLSVVLMAGLALPAWGQARITVLVDVLRLDEVTAIMREEGLRDAEGIDDDMLGGQGGAFWAAQIARIFNPARMTETVRAALAAGMTEPELEAALAFFGTERGERIVTLENAARRAMDDSAIEDATAQRYRDLRASSDVLLEQIDHFVALNDLIDRNVAATMSATYQYYSGLEDGKLIDLSDTEILATVWEQEGEIRADAETWLYSYLLLAYQPLAPGDLAAYVTFSESAAGRALNAALFAGYETMYRDISYALGRAVALSSTGSDL